MSDEGHGTGTNGGHPASRYDRHYFETALGPAPYDRRHPEWMEFFGTIADHIVAEIKPARVLDVGCAKGFLVEALRDRGVDAFGIDISEYAIGEVRPDIRPYCRVASAVDPFDGPYDLIVCIEVLEHLGQDEGRRALANIRRATGDVLFSSTPDDFTEPTHVNVRPRSWWVEELAGQGFQLDVEFDAGFIAAHAMRFREGLAAGTPLDPLLAQRHRLLRQLAALRIDVEGRDGAIAGLRIDVEGRDGAIAGLHAAIADLHAAVADGQARRDQAQNDLVAMQQESLAKDAVVAELHAAVAALHARHNRVQSDLGAVQRGAQSLRNELTARRLEMAALRQESLAKDAVVADLRTDVATLEESVEHKDAVVADLHATVAALHARHDHVQSDLAAVQRGAEALRNELAVRRSEVAAFQQESLAKDALVQSLQAEVAVLHRGAEDKDTLIAGLNYHLLALQRTIGWKILKPLRRLRDRLLPPDSRRRDLYWRVRRPVEVLLDEGMGAFFRKTRYKIWLRWQGRELLVKAPPRAVVMDREEQYQGWIERHRPSRQDVTRMKRAVEAFTYTPVISVVTPVYNTDEIWLRKAIESVRAQIYPHWELCLVNDGSTAPHVRAVLDEYVLRDPRARVTHLSENHGIVGASSHGLALATGDFVALLDHDDELPPEALFEVVKLLHAEPDLDLVYTDEDKLDPDGRRVEPFFKPDWSPDLLLSMNYITHLSVFRRSLLAEIGGFRPGLDGSQDYDLLLRFTERAAGRIAHLPKVLYHWRKIPGSAAASPTAKPFAYDAGRRAIEEAVRRRGREARVESGLPGLYTVRYKVTGTPLVSIIVPTRDRWSLLRQCLRSIEEKTSYARYEIIVLDNDSVEPETRAGLDVIAEKWRVYPYPGSFNFSALNNFGAARARGDFLVFLNNDTQVIEADWLTAMLEHAQWPEVGAVGARLHYPDGRIQHAGLTLGVGGVADHAFKGLPGDTHTYFAFASVVRNVSAVTAACMMVPRRVFGEVGGFDERLRVALNDVDLCLRLRQRGYRIVYTPFALLYHLESGTRGRLHPPRDEELVWTAWGDLIRKGDPYYNPNLTLSRNDWSLAGG